MNLLNVARRKMAAYDFAGASDLLMQLLEAEPANEEAMVLYGVCRRLLGDEKSFLDIGKRLGVRLGPSHRRIFDQYQKLCAAACGAVLLMAARSPAETEPPAPVYGGPTVDIPTVVETPTNTQTNAVSDPIVTTPTNIEEPPLCVYAGPPIDEPEIVDPGPAPVYGGPTINEPVIIEPEPKPEPVPFPALKPVKPKASDGRHTLGVEVTWKAVKDADHYVVLRAPKRSFEEAERIATTDTLAYFDQDTACSPKVKFYYWVVPVNESGYEFPAPKKSDAGYSKQHLTVDADTTTLYIGESVAISVAGAPCEEVSPTDCKWKVSSKSKGEVSPEGVLTAKKKGRVTVTTTYKGAKAKLVFTVLPGVRGQ